VPAFAWLGFGWFLNSQITRFLQTPIEFTLPMAAFALWVVMRLLRPLRKSFNLRAYVLMVQSPFPTLVQLGVWKLLVVSHQYWPTEEPLYEGTVAFTAAYAKRQPKWQYEINGMLWKVEMFGKVHLAKAAREFLREVGGQQQRSGPSVEPDVVAKTASELAAPPPPAPSGARAIERPAAMPQKRKSPEKRSSRRIYINARARIRRTDGRTEIVATLDASRDGLAFQSKQQYSLGELLQVAMHYRDGEEPIETPGCIVRVTPRAPRSEYGVKLG
jgi:hypothetical protein